MVAKVTVCGTTVVAGGELDCVAMMVDKSTDVFICVWVIASVTVLVVGDDGAVAVGVFPPSTATTE